MPSTSSRSTEPRWLIGWGLRIRSAIDLPGAAAWPANDETSDLTPDLTIAFGTADSAADVRSHGPYDVHGAGFSFTMPGVARYACSATTILIDPMPGAPDDHVAAMLIATAIPAWLWRQGEIVLHAAAAILPGTTRAVAVLGASGSGKSTLLARAVAAGAAIVADDSIRVRIMPGGVRISGLPGGYFAPLGTAAEDRRFHQITAERQVTDAPLGALIVLDERNPPDRLTGAAAVGAVLTHRHRPRIAQLLGIEGRALETIAGVCREIPIFGLPAESRLRPADRAS